MSSWFGAVAIRVSVHPSFFREVNTVSAHPPSPTFAWSLAPDGDVEGGRESASGKRTAGWEKVGCPGALSGSQCPQKPRHPPSAPHQVLPHHSQLSVTLGSFQGQTMDFTSLVRSGLLPPALPKFQPYPVTFQGLGIYRHLSEVQKAGPRLISKCLLCIFFRLGPYGK